MGQQESSLGSAGYALPSAAGSLHRVSSSSSAPSSASSGAMTRRRLDMRWGRLTTDQLRDEEFLTKQLRRMETLLGANARRQHAASTGRNASPSSNATALASRAVFVSATPSRLSLQQRLVHGKAGDAASSHSPDDQGDESALAGGLESDRSTANVKQCELLAGGEADVRRELDLLNALYLFGELEQPELAALMLQKLKELLLRLCTFPDPFYDLLALRRYILRSVHEAVQVQHQHQRALVNLSSAALESIRNAILQAQVPQLNLLPSARGYSGPSTSLVSARRRSAATARMSGVDSSVSSSGILLPLIKPKEKIAREASMGIQVVFSLFASMSEQSSTSLAQRKEILNELLPLIQNLASQSLAPKSVTQTSSSSRATQGSVAGRGISSGNGVLGSTVASGSQELVERIQRFLLEICPTPPLRPGLSSPKVQLVAPSAGEFDVADRTNAVNALVYLAAARSSLRDFLLAVKVILGADTKAEWTLGSPSI
ncbi:Hect e3 ubiquitin [Globisporangium polare]